MTQDLIDSAVFEELTEAMGTEFAADLIETFISDAPNMFAELETAFAGGDADAYRRAAHSIKSNAQVFGATALGDRARQMELSDMTPDSAALVAALQSTYDQTAAALRGLLDE